MTEEFEIAVRPKRHTRGCPCETCDRRRVRLIAYFRGKVTTTGIIPGAYQADGTPKRYRHVGRVIGGDGLIYLAS